MVNVPGKSGFIATPGYRTLKYDLIYTPTENEASSTLTRRNKLYNPWDKKVVPVLTLNTSL